MRNLNRSRLSASKLQALRQACVNFAARRKIYITEGAYGFDSGLYEIEYVLHELGHAAGLELDMYKFVGDDIDACIKALSSASKDHNEAQAVAVEFFLARRLGVQLSRRKVMLFARTPLQLRWSAKAWDLYVADREKELCYLEETATALRLIRAEVMDLENHDGEHHD